MSDYLRGELVDIPVYGGGMGLLTAVITGKVLGRKDGYLMVRCDDGIVIPYGEDQVRPYGEAQDELKRIEADKVYRRKSLRGDLLKRGRWL